MNNTFEGFVSYCKEYGIKLNDQQVTVAKQLFDIPLAGGKTMLTVLLYAYDPAANFVFNNMHSELGLSQNSPGHMRTNAS